MSNIGRSQEVHEIRELAEQLRSQRQLPSGLELERMRERAEDGLLSGQRMGFPRRGFVTLVLACMMVGGGTAGVWAAAGGNPGSGGSSASAPNNQYCPPTSNNPGAPKKSGLSCGKQETN